jgi:hypothetical protein
VRYRRRSSSPLQTTLEGTCPSMALLSLLKRPPTEPIVGGQETEASVGLHFRMNACSRMTLISGQRSTRERSQCACAAPHFRCCSTYLRCTQAHRVRGCHSRGTAGAKRYIKCHNCFVPIAFS